MSRQSRKNRREKPLAAPSSATRGNATNAAVPLFPPGKPLVWQKWCFAAAIFFELTWIVVLVFLVLLV
jgi:hypothetical protein